jgi:hypothetical protein
MITIYVGEYSVPAFVGVLFPTVYQASATTGCFMMVLQQPVGGTAGQARHRDAAGSDNSFGIGELANSSSSYTSLNDGPHARPGLSAAPRATRTRRARSVRTTVLTLRIR